MENGECKLLLKLLLPSMVCCWLSRIIASCLLIANSFHRKLHFENCPLSRTDKLVYSLGYLKGRDHANEPLREDGEAIMNTQL